MQSLFRPNLSRKKYDFHLLCSAVSTVTRSVIIHRFGEAGWWGWVGYVLKWRLWRRWHSFKKVEAALICTARYRSVIHAFLAVLSLNFIMVWMIMGVQSPSMQALYLLYFFYLSLQPVRWVSISRWQAMAYVVNVLSTATQRPELPSPAPVTPTTIERQMTQQRLHAPVSTNTRYTRSANPISKSTLTHIQHTTSMECWPELINASKIQFPF